MARKPYLEFSIEDRHVGASMYVYGLKNGWFENKSKENGCEACLMPLGSGPIELHREDYSIIDPSELIVICYRCHRVLHMRDRYPEGWDFYREKVREGYRWPWTKDIGPAAGAMRSMNLNGARLVNEPRDRTVLDDIHDGVYLKGTPEDRQDRLKNLYKLEAEIKSGSQVTLFDDRQY
jgi:hypothetical protein